MHIIQEKLLKLAQEKNLGQLTLREIAYLIDESVSSPQKIKHHLNQLEKKGFIRIDKVKGVIERTQPGWVKGLLGKTRLLSIPIIGSADCGPANILAEANIEGYLRVSSSLIKHRTNRDLFALKASGPSMNRVDIDGKSIEDGDYLIIDSGYKTPVNNDVVLSIIDGMANVKSYYFDKENNQIVLMSKSTQDFPPIYIHPEDSYKINGKVIQIIKKPKMKHD